MPLSPGTRIGPYEISAPLGAGGMGEVYRARDSRLNRDVAIKTLPAAFAGDASRMARFEREAQVLAALNHPNIAAIYGLEERALVIELVEGATLAERIAQGPLPLDEALAVARQIAEALDAAHEKGIVHRDLKPANVKITPEGKVKVLDFGLAKAFEPEAAAAAGANLTHSPTLTLEATRAGVILGTAGYMSPEQARGKPADKRADIWSFGVVLYEMLTGRSTFEGETVSDTLAAVLRADLDWSRLPAGTPPKVRRLLERCLERDPRRRLRDIGDALLELEQPDEPAPAPTVAAPESSPLRRLLPWSLAAILAIAAGWGWLHTPSRPPRPVTRWTLAIPDLFTVGAVNLSRDGTRVAYTSGPSNPHLVLRMLDQFESKPIPGGERAFAPVFSTDGQWIVYGSGTAVKKMPVTGGTSISISETANSFGYSWGDDGSIVLNMGADKGLARVPASGGAPQPLTTPDKNKGETSHRWPQVLPGSKAVIFTIGAGGSWDGARIAVLDLNARTWRVLVNAGTCGKYVPSGHLVYARGGTLFAVTFDVHRLQVTGAEVPVVEGVLTVNAVGFADYSFADTGLLIYTPGGQQQMASTLEWSDRKGARQPTAAPPQFYGGLRISPDGERVAAAISGSDFVQSDIWVYEFARGTLTRVTFEGINSAPTWSPDGKRIAFRSFRNEKNNIYVTPIDGSAPAQLLLTRDTNVNPNSWTPDGKALLYTQTETDGRSHVWVAPVSGTGADGQPQEFLRTPLFSEINAQISPDGKWVAYQSNETGAPQIYVRPFPGPGGKIQISTQPTSTNPRWSRSGRELFYRESTGQFWVVQVQPGAAFHAGQPQPLVKQLGVFDVAPDGQRFLLEKSPLAVAGGKMMAVVDWFEELRRRAKPTP